MSREKLQEIYLDWVNNFLTISKYAEHHGLYEEEALALIALAKSAHNRLHPEA